MMSKDCRTVRLYSYERHSCSLYEKRFEKGYKFMTVSHEGDKTVFSVSWDDVVVLLGFPVVKTLYLYCEFRQHDTYYRNILVKIVSVHHNESGGRDQLLFIKSLINYCRKNRNQNDVSGIIYG